MNLRSKISHFIRKLHKKLAHHTILVLGDSHVAVFHNIRFLIAFPFTRFEVVSVGGATASGLENPRSKTQANKIFKEALYTKRYDHIIVMLGEVDTGFVIWYRAKKYNESVEKMFSQAVQNYCKLIETLRFKAPVTVISTPLPTIDDSSRGEVAHARKEITASQVERTDLTIYFNTTIQNYCQQHGINYINLDKLSLGPNGIVKNELKNKKPTDHHYDSNKYALLIIQELKKNFPDI